MFLLIILLIPCVYSLFEDSKLVKGLSDFDDIGSVLDDLKYVSLFYFYINENCQFCKEGEMLMEVVANENDGIFKVYHIDCESLWED